MHSGGAKKIIPALILGRLFSGMNALRMFAANTTE
jgi:hypothetical protein